jgi:hypothetical protein
VLSSLLALIGVPITGLGIWGTVGVAIASESDPEAGLAMLATLFIAGVGITLIAGAVHMVRLPQRAPALPPRPDPPSGTASPESRRDSS